MLFVLFETEWSPCLSPWV